MAYLLDTCVLSEGSKSEFHPSLAAWFESTTEDERFTSVLSLAEIQYGILRMPHGRRRTQLGMWYEGDLLPIVEGRLISFGETEAMEWTLLRSMYPNARYIDSQIAACALVHNLTLVTRNAKDFEFEGLSVVNPWGDGD